VIKDIIGQRFGRLVVLSLEEKRKSGQLVWKCQCDCGNITMVQGCNLKNGHTKSCGCILSLGLMKSRGKDLTGQRFGRLVALKPTDMRKKGKVVWECKCDCGNIVSVQSNKLKSGHKKSCGCIRSLDLMEGRAKDLTGQRFGKLVALKPTDMRKNGQVIWECKCDCGEIAFVASRDLTQGKVNSCGCLPKSILQNAKVNDLTGQKFGNLLVLKLDEERSEGQHVWQCQCDCGNIVSVRGGNLKSGHTKSCGCRRSSGEKKTRAKDLTGLQFGRLVASRPTEERKNGFVVWECLCDCGKTAFVTSHNLLTGRIKSCGCAANETVLENGKIDLTGQRFGKLVALRPTEERRNGFVMWECKCDCGNTTFARSSNLKNGHKTSCGCIWRPGLPNGNAKELAGQRFGKLVALRPTDMRKNGQVVWECKCDCGNITFLGSASLKKGRNLSCGCLQEEKGSKVSP